MEYVVVKSYLKKMPGGKKRFRVKSYTRVKRTVYRLEK